MDLSAYSALQARLAHKVGRTVAEPLLARVTEAIGTPQGILHISALLDELEGVSAKAVHAAIDAMPELERCAGFSELIPWLDMGIALAESSGATALRYFKQSPEVLGMIDGTERRRAVLAIALELADRDGNVAWEYLRAAPNILQAVPLEDVARWLDLAIELVTVDVVVGLEYIRQIARVASVIPITEAGRWLSFGMKLVTPNTLGKPDYLAAIEFMRTSPSILGDIEHPAVRTRVLTVGIILAEDSPESGVMWLTESPGLLRALPSMERQVTVLQYGALLAEQDAEAALHYFRRCPEVMSLIGDGPQAGSRFETWFTAGMEVLAYSREGGRAYFAVESLKALASVEQAMSGVPLRQIARKVKLFVQGLCGTDVTVTALSESSSTTDTRAVVSADGRAIALPAVLRRYATAEENERLYMVMAAHEAGHLEFGTYRLRLDSLGDVCKKVRVRYGHPEAGVPNTLAALFQLYPHPRLAQDLWTVLEDARIEYLLQVEYPGLRRDLARLAAEAVTPRDPSQGLSVKELLVDCLLRLSTGESVESAVPHAVQEEVAALWALCGPLFQPTATAEDVVRLAHALYVMIEEQVGVSGDEIEPDSAQDDSEETETASAPSERTSDGYRPMTNPVYRGAMNPEVISRDRMRIEQTGEQESDGSHAGGERAESPDRSGSAIGTGQRGHQSEDLHDLAGGQTLHSAVEELLLLDVEQRPDPMSPDHDERAIRYPEWDHTIQDYRANWCRVVERSADTGSSECVDTALATHRSVIKSIRRFFEGLRPPAFRRVPGQAEGEDPDIDAVVRRAVELRAGLDGDERVYVRREKRERDVAAMFLVDVSGSTGRRLESGHRVIDIEKESLVLLCEALEAVGDQYGLCAYSGQGRAAVDFLVVKDFDDRLGTVTAHRLGGLGPRQQNRDGAAIRHASAKLLAREAKSRILVVVSDGKPLDGEYKDEYALEDTKAALREAKARGIEPFCVTIDREADGYVRRMYGDVQFAVIDRVESLPSRLPRIYQRLTA
ncbi:MAG: VWA domain-containing protein [Nitrospira sp.]|nr:VWA domain-containing protein [Nitrospira sp.]